MRRDPRPYLHDVVRGADAILELVNGKTAEDYLHDGALRAAVERHFIVMGEALYQLRHHFPELAKTIPDARHLISFRHVLVHGYDQVGDDVGWGVIETMLQQVRDGAAAALQAGD